MSSDADLTTDDLAGPGGARGRDAGGAGERTPGRGAGAAGAGLDERAPVNDGGDTAQPTQGTGATRDDVRTVPVQQGGGERGADPGERAGAVPQARAVQEEQRPGMAADRGDGADMALVDPAEGEQFRQRWSDVQARFVDDPREAVQTADGLVAELMQSLARGFSQHKGRLESAWQSGDDPDTEELRQALQRYRSFFNRLLST